MRCASSIRFPLSDGVLLGGLLFARASLAAPAAPVVTTDGDPKAGHVTVEWRMPDGAAGSPIYEVQMGASADFRAAKVIYTGPQTSSVRSGIPDGTRFYRARARIGAGEWGPWSAPSAFSVEHYSPATAGILLGIGALVFVVTAWSVARGEATVEE